MARSALTVRLAPVGGPVGGREADLRAGLRRLSELAPTRPGVTGLHLLKHAVAPIAATAEQRLRGLADGAADWVVIASGYDRGALAELGAGELGEQALVAMGAVAGSSRALFDLGYAAIGTDLTGIAMPAAADPTA